MLTEANNKQAKEIIVISTVLVLIYFVANFFNPWITSLLHLEKPSPTIYFLNDLLRWVVLLTLAFLSRYWMKEDFFVWKDTKRSFFFHIISVACILAVLFIVLVIFASLLNALDLNSVSEKRANKIISGKDHLSVVVFTALTAGVVEELLFRGFIQPRITRWANSQLAGILITSLVFGLMHISYGTVVQVIIPTVFSLVFCIFYEKYKNIKPIIAAHFLWDLISILDSAYNSR